jgi:hypothetical protein
MPASIKITTGTLAFPAELNDSPTAGALKAMLPLDIAMSRWGDEYYGDCGIKAELSADAREEMKVGELAVWPVGRALCIFFGPTPASREDEPRAVSPVNPVGMITGSIDPLRQLSSTIRVRIEKAD